MNEFLAGIIPLDSIDLDGNSKCDALTDDLLLVRAIFGLDDDILMSEAVATDAIYKSSEKIESGIVILCDLADIDGNGDIQALSDGLLTLRYLFSLQGDVIIDGVASNNAIRITAQQIEAHVNTLMLRCN